MAAETGVSPATLFRWKHQALVDAGAREGVPSVDSDELAVARRRIAQLEEELQLTRDACELFDEQVVVTQKEDRGRRRTDRQRAFEPVVLSDHRAGPVDVLCSPEAARS